MGALGADKKRIITMAETKKTRDILFAEKHLSGEQLQNYINFDGFLRNNKFSRGLTNKVGNKYSVRFQKSDYFCCVKIHENSTWRISLFKGFGKYKWYEKIEPYLSSELRSFVLDNINTKLGCSRCKSARNVVIYGKIFGTVCDCHSILLHNPDVKTIEYVKELLLATKQMLEETNKTEVVVTETPTEEKKGDKHFYCCQNRVQNLYDHIIPVPDDFDVNPDCLYGIDKGDFINGLKELTETVKSVYADMIQNPAEYGLPLVEDKHYYPFNPKAAESKNSCYRLMVLLYTMVQNSVLNGSELNVHEKDFTNGLKKLKSVYKVTNSKKIISRLGDFGFVYEKNVFSYPDNPNVIPALYGYMKNVRSKDAIFSLNYHFATREPSRPSVFAGYLSENNREFFLSLSESLLHEGFFLGNGAGYGIYSYKIDYSDTQKKDSYLVRFSAPGLGQLRMQIKLYNSGCYDKYLDTLPEHIKQIFRREATCEACNGQEGKGCPMSRPRIFEGKEILDCASHHDFKSSYFVIKSFNPGDAEYYKQLLLLEREAIKTNAQKKGIKVYPE